MNTTDHSKPKIPMLGSDSAFSGTVLRHLREARAEMCGFVFMILRGPWLTVPKQMCLNVHPSVLPSFRGPTPLFWQFREGEHETGVTLNMVEEDVDAGDAVLALERDLDYHDDAGMAVPFDIDGDPLRIRFSEGVLEAVGRRIV